MKNVVITCDILGSIEWKKSLNVSMISPNRKLKRLLAIRPFFLKHK